LANRETRNRRDEFRLVRERQVYTADKTEVVPPKPCESRQAELPVLQMPVRAGRPGDTDPSRGELRNASPVRTASAARTVATRGIDAIVNNDCETACASSDQRRVSQRRCRTAPSHADTDDFANRFARCVAVVGDDAHAIGFGVICATRGG
jgi:hypothetical protein